MSDENFFDSYPYCKLDTFTFNVEALQENGRVMRDENGLHWVEVDCPHTQSHSHGHGTGSKNGLNGWGISILNDGKIFEGVYHDSQPCGTGYELQSNGNTYVGSFK